MFYYGTGTHSVCIQGMSPPRQNDDVYSLNVQNSVTNHYYKLKLIFLPEFIVK